MEELTGILILVGFITGMCLGAIIISSQDRIEYIPDTNPTLEKLIYSQRDSLRALRVEFNKFRENHERELITLLRETLRGSSRSILSDDEEPSVSS